MDRLIDKLDSYEKIKELSSKELFDLADEIRDFLKESICRTGGHLGVNTGVVELTLALHFVFDSLYDKFIWDVGHNVYVHKILTGRADLLYTLRQDEGSPGFPAKDESEHDVLDTSHGGTSLSVASGIAISNRIQNKGGLPIAIIGDSALGEGMALEALNHIGYEKPNMLIIVNDNGWGITENKTAIKSYLSQRSDNPEISEGFFTSLGFDYKGPIDGHDLDCLIRELKEIKQNPNGPMVLHVKTQKGNGLDFPKDEITNHHFCFPLDKTGSPITEDKEQLKSMIENQQKITEIYTEQSYDELKEVLHNYLNPSDTDSNETGAVGNTEAAKDDGLDKVVDEKTEKNSDVEAAFDDLFNS